MLLTGDLGFMALEPFRDRFPDRFCNVGVAEQNMIGVATGLAEAGLHPVRLLDRYLRHAAPLRVHPQRTGLHGLPVRIVGIGGGFDYGRRGPRTTPSRTSA